MSRTDPAGRILDRDAPRRLHAEPACRLEVDVGRRLSLRHLLRRHGHLEVRCQARDLEHTVDQRPVRRRRDAEPPVRRETLHRVDGAVDQRQTFRVTGEHPAHDLTVDLLGRLREADHFMQVARPFGRAHPHHVRLRLRAPATTAFARETLAHLVPQFLAVDDDPVEVEHDRVDHAGRYSPPRYTRPWPGRPSSVDSTSPTKIVWSPASCSDDVRHSSHASASFTSGPRVPSRTSTPFHSATGGMPLRAKCCAIVTWAPDSKLAVHPPARRIGSCDDESLPIEMPTRAGCSESDTSEPTVSPNRSPSTAAVTTATGAGKRRITSRSSSPSMPR